MKKPFASVALAVLLALAIVSMAFAAPAAVKTKPFKGSLQAVETTQVNFPILLVDANGSGNGTHLGGFDLHYTVVVNLITLSATNAAEFTAANGDKVFAVGTGQGTPTSTPNVDSIVENYTITGGTGRFAGASGSFTLLRELNLVTGVTSGAYTGTIVLP